MFRLPITFLIIIFALSLNIYSQSREIPKGWKEFKKCGLSFLTPKNVSEQKIQGIDSCVGEFKGGNLSIGFDFGWYTATPGSGSVYPDTKYEWIEIDGLKAHLTTHSKGARVYIVTDVQEVDKNKITSALGFSVFFKKPEDATVARKIIESIRFVEKK